MSSEYNNNTPPPEPRPQPHPYLHEPLLYISGLPAFVRDEDLAVAFQTCAPFRPNIPRDGSNKPLSGTIEFKYLEKGESIAFRLLSRAGVSRGSSVIGVTVHGVGTSARMASVWIERCLRLVRPFYGRIPGQSVASVPSDWLLLHETAGWRISGRSSCWAVKGQAVDRWGRGEHRTRWRAQHA